MLQQLLDILSLSDANTRVVLLGAGLLGLVCGVVGALAVLRRHALVSDAVAHASLPGICVAFLIVGDRNFGALLVGALVFGLLAAGSIALVRRFTRVKEDAAVALAISVFFGLGVVLTRVIQQMPGGNAAGLDSFIFGKAASMVRADVWRIASVAVIALLAVGVFRKELSLACFDRQFARVEGFRPGLVDAILMGLVCACTIVGLPAVGIILIVALLIIPGATARLLTDRLGPLLIIAGVIGATSAMVGTVLSSIAPTPASALTRGWPTGPSIVVVAAFLFLSALFLAPRRGVLARLFGRVHLRHRIGIQNLLRSAYERTESSPTADAAWSLSELSIAHATSRLAMRWRLGHARRRGLISSTPSGFRLTPAGTAEAQRLVRIHRLWELYLIHEAAVAPEHVDRGADEIEHVLPPELLSRLEVLLLQEQSISPALVGATLPHSPHPLTRIGESQEKTP
jgi:manganese/zinc/iron transport system permease protein